MGASRCETLSTCILPLSTTENGCGFDSPLSSSSVHAQARTYIESMPYHPRKDFSKFFVGANPLAIDVLERLLVMDPDTRMTAEEALAHPYFASYADPDDEVMMM